MKLRMLIVASDAANLNGFTQAQANTVVVTGIATFDSAYASDEGSRR